MTRDVRRSPAPDVGRVLRKGRIRVDARKAMAKLREHLLVDLHLYAVEVVRAAVLAGATRVDVRYDADDVEITFDGEPLEAAALPHLFEHLTGDDASGAHHQRLLALAVNAALGLDPAWVSLATSSGGSASRVVWSPALVAAIEREEKPLPQPEAIAVRDLPAEGTRFHLRRKVGWATVRQAAARTPPREVALLIQAAHCLRVPLFVNGAAPAPSGRPAALASAPISLPGVRHARVEVVMGHEAAPHVDFCELGILLCRAGLSFGRHFPMAEHHGVHPPVRVVVDSDGLPTNASRSAVREDAPLFASLASAAAPALSDALAGIAATLFGRGEVPDGVNVDGRNPAALHDALGAFVCAAEASLLARVRLPDALRALLDLPLYHDGLGRPLTHDTIPREDPLLVWAGEAPVPAQMEPWARRIVWRKGRLAERVLRGRTWFEPEKLAELAKRGAERHAKLFAMPAGPASVPDDAYLARERFRFEQGSFAGLSGEVAIAASPSAHVRNLALRVFLRGRLYEAYPLPEDAVPLPCVIALEWPGQLVPKLGYEGIETTNGVHAALAFAVRQAVFLCERTAAERSARGERWDAAGAAVLRAALATAVAAPSRMLSVEGFEMPALADLPGLVGAPVWPATSGSFVSLQALCDHAAKTGAICVASPGSAGRAADGRPVLAVTTTEIDWLTSCLKPGITVIRYDGALLPASSPTGRDRPRTDMIDLVDTQAAISSAPVFRLDTKNAACAITLGGVGTRIFHAGTEVSRILLDESFGGLTIGVDDDSIVPTAKWSGILYADDQTIAGRAERLYAERVVAAILGDERARADLHRALADSRAGRYEWPERLTDLPASVVRFLIDRAARGRFASASEDDRAFAWQIEQIPLLVMIQDGQPAPASLSDVTAAHPPPNKIPYLRAPPRFRPAAWRPLIAWSGDVLDALSRWSGGRVLDASGEILAQERIAEREHDLARFRVRPTVDTTTVGPRGDTSCPVAFLAYDASSARDGVATALPAADQDVTVPVVEVTLEGRVACEQILPALQFPLIARVDFSDRDCFEGFDRLSEKGLRIAAARVQRGAVELAVKVLERAREPGLAHTFFADERALRLVLAALSFPDRDPRVDDGLRGNTLRWPTVQGGARLFGELRMIDGELWTGTDLYSPWLVGQTPTDLDRPILHAPTSPEGYLVTAILQKLGLKIRAVTEAVAALQAKRAHGMGDRPRLAERPAHPALVRDLSTLQVEGMEGEIAIYEAGEAVLGLSALDGDVKRIPLELSFPVRAVARTEVLTSSATAIAVQKLTRAAVRFLVGLVPQLDALPPFVRSHLRAITCKAVQQGREIPAAARSAPIFPDIDGGWWSIADLQSSEHGDWSCTFDPPPYPRSRQEGHTLRLSTAEHLQLHEKIKILNVTEWMRRDLDAERRREAEPVTSVRLPAEVRASLVSSFLVEDGSLEGEIGVLRPACDGARGIHALTTRRPVCRIDDAPGWPIVATINDDALRPNRWWTELLPAQETELRARVRALATRHLRERLASELPPQPPLAQAFIDEVVPPVAAYGSTEPMTVTGHLYLPSRWPETPAVRLFVQRIEEPARSPVSIATACIQQALPICGALYISHAAPIVTAGAASRVGLAVRTVAARLLAPLVQKNPRDPEIQTYQWNLRLLGATNVGEPAAIAADGRALHADEVIAQLHERGEIWLTDRQGTIEGEFPNGAPTFFLPDDDAPLLRVLRARLPRQKLKWLGAGAEAKRPASPSEVLAPASVRPAGAPSFEPAAPRGRAMRSWLGEVIFRARSFLVNEPLPESEATGIGAAVERTLRALRLRDEPVVSVHEVTRGKLVHFDTKRGVVSINVAHPALARHLAAPTTTVVRRVVVALVAAAVSEVNIALEHVTDHDEEQALLELLRQEAAAGRGRGAA